MDTKDQKALATLIAKHSGSNPAQPGMPLLDKRAVVNALATYMAADATCSNTACDGGKVTSVSAQGHKHIRRCTLCSGRGPFDRNAWIQSCYGEE